jgi:hypothetical protein
MYIDIHKHYPLIYIHVPQVNDPSPLCREASADVISAVSAYIFIPIKAYT